MLEQLKTVERLKKIIKENGLKQVFVADKIGANRYEFSKFVNGKAALPKKKYESLLQWLEIYEQKDV